MNRDNTSFARQSIQAEMNRTEELIAQAERVSAHNYAPLQVVLSRARGVWAWDIEGRRYLDCLSAYSALSLGHCHPRVLAALTEQAAQLTLTSRAFHNDRMGPFLAQLCDLCEMAMAVPMNTGAEAVETAIKLARKWGYRVKGVPHDQAEIIVCRDNFHGRTTTIVGFSSDSFYRQDFGPYGPGFKLIDFGDVAQLEAAITDATVGFLVEPIQAEAGIKLPPPGYLSAVRRVCAAHNVLLMLDEIQTGLGRTGKLLAHQHEAEAKPDVLILGKALGGGVYPVSAVLGSTAIIGLLEPGEHGSTFGGNPLAAAVGQAALNVICGDDLAARAATLGAYLLDRLQKLGSPAIAEIRGRGLLVGIEVSAESRGARAYCDALLEHGVLTKDTHERVIRLAPPLVIERAEIDWLVEQLESVLAY
jgi:ornithine--oxo-acid transaminase